MNKQATGFNQPEIDIDVLMGHKPIPTSSTQPQAPMAQNGSGSAIDMDVLMGRKPIPTAGEQPEPSESSEVGEIPNNPDAAFDAFLGLKIDSSPEAIRERSEYSTSPFVKGIRDAVGSVQAQGGYDSILGKGAVDKAAQKKVYQPLNKNLADAVQKIMTDPRLQGYELNADNLDTYLKTEEEREAFEEALRERYGDSEASVSDLSTISRPMESRGEILRSVVFTHNGKNIEIPIGLAEDWVAQHNAEVQHNEDFREDPEYRNQWFLSNLGISEQTYRNEVAADLENRLQELRKKVVATLPAQHTRGGYAAIGAAANKPSSGGSVSIQKIDKALKTVNTLRKNSFGAGLKEGFDLADILTLGVSGIGENVALLNALNKSASGKTLTTSEQALVEAWDIQNEAEEVMQVLGGRSLASNIGRGGAQSLGFITQTVGTGGLASAATKGITRAAAKSALKRVASTGVASKIQEGVRYGSLKAAESLVGAAARTPFMGFTYRNYTDKRLNQFQVNERVDEATGEISKYIDKQESSALRDAAHAALESYFESQSEDVGGLIDFGITSFARALPIKQFIRSSVVNGMTGAVKNGAMKWIKESAKIYGLAGEVLSEAYGDAAVNLLTSNTDGWKQMASSEYWWELLGVSSMLSGGFGVVNRAVNSYSGRNLDRQIAHEDNNRRNALSRIEDDMLKKELTEISLTDDLIERSKMLSSLDWSNFTKEDMANTIDFISAQTRLDVMRESDMESRRLARIMPAIDEVKTLSDNGALDEDQAAASLAVIYSGLFRTQENQRALNILTDRIKVAADAGISADEINEILRGAGLTVFNPGDEIETLTGDRAIVDKVLPGAYEVVNNEGDRAVVSFEEVLQNTPEVRQIQQESNQTEGQTESAPENNPQVEQAVADARAQVAEIINKDDSTVYEVETDDGITGYIIGGKGIVVDSDGRIKQSAEDTVVVKTDEGNRVVHKERVKVKNRQTLQEIEDLARGAAEGALAAVQPQQPVGGKTYQGIYDNEQVTITLPREIKFNEDGTVDYDNLMNPETVSVIRPNGAVVDEVGLNEIEQLTEVQPEAEQVSADVPAVEQQEATNLEPDFSAIRPVSIGDFGPIYDQFRGNAKDAIALLLQRKDGEAVGALSHPEVGEIDLVWGHEGTSKSDGYGLSKLAKYHPEVLENLQEILNDMKVASRTENRVQLESDTHKASVRLTWNEQKKNWLLTAFEKKEASASIGKTTDTNDNPKDLRGDTALSQNADALSDNKDTTFEPKNQEVAQKNVTEAAPVVQQPQIPLLKNGEPDYNAMDARMFAEQYVTRFGEGATERIARNNIKASNKTISTIEKQIEDVTDPNKMPALYSKLQDAQATKDKYSAVLEELGLSADESEDNAARIQRKKQENTPWFNKLFPDGFPNVESVILWDIANGNRIRWTNKEVNGAVVSKGLGSHLGLADSNAERTRRVALIGKDAPTPEEYAEQLPERLNAMGIRFEESELLDTVIAVYTSVDTVRKAKEELEKISANIQAEQEGLDYEEEQVRRNYEREQEALRQEAQADVVDEQTEQEQPTNEETQEEELSIEDEVPFMISGNPLASETTEAVMSSAKNEFEETDDWSLTGWLLPDGTQLSFSEEGGYERDIDHRAIGLAYAGSVDERWKYLQDFEQRGGIRVSMNYGSSSIELSVKPTSAQFSKLSSFVRESGGNVDIDFMDENYNTSHSASYDSVNSSRVLSDIERYFDEGIKPSGNVSFEIAEARRKNKNEAHQLATEAAITALEDAGLEVVNATPEMVEEALQRKDVQLQAVNQKFNEQLDSFTEENANAVIFDLGMPSPMLIAGGVPNKPIRLYGSKLLKKIRKHGFSAAELSGLPMALANPIAVFNNYQREGNRSVLIELSTADGNFLVSIDIGAGSDIDFDIVKSVFGKDGDGILNWINKGYLTTVDKEKALAYLRISAPIAEASNKQELDSATKIVENFENPKIEPDNSFSIGSAPVFVSNAKIAVLGIKQEKATPEQWLKMIEKAGGLKAGEDKWIGLSDWLKTSDKKTLTKREVLDYINENQIQIEETTYSSNSAVERTPEFKALQEEFKQLVKSYEDEAKLEKKYNFTDTFDTTVLNSDESKAHSSLSRAVGEAYNAAWVDLVDKYGDDFEIAFWRCYDGIRVDNAEAAGVLLGLPIDRPIYHLREDYTTNGLEGNREIALTVSTIEPWNENDEVHFGDAGEGRAIAWVRFGETMTPTDEAIAAKKDVGDYLASMREKYGSKEGEETDAMTADEISHLQSLTAKEIESREKGLRVLVIDEIQSKRHQEGRERGYGFVGDVAKAREDADEAYRKVVSFENDMTSKYGDQYWTGDATNEEVAHWELLRSELDRLGVIYENLAEKQRKSVPEAPFEKNWAELAMKRMLRYAAENDFDKVAWTKGDQQNERYQISHVVDFIHYNFMDGDKGSIRMEFTKGGDHHVGVDKSTGLITFYNEQPQLIGKPLSDLLGKPLAEKIISNKVDYGTIKGDGLNIGGEGMRAFYDQILPSFMNKYGKKWGVKVQDVTLPYVEEAGRTMHSVDVTDSMRESVMQGQPMFYRRPNGTVYGWTNGTTVYLTESGMNPNTPIHEYTHIWADAMRKHNPEGWKSILKLLKGTPVWNEVMNDTNYANIHSDEHKVASEALSRISGRENAAKMEAMAQQMIDENANDTVKKNRARKLLDRMRKALQEFWSWVGKELFGIKNFESIEQVTDRILYDLVSGTDLTSVSSFDTPAAERNEIISKAKANGTYLKAPNGKDTNLTPEQWVTVRTKAFKRWFGDWEKAARIEKLRTSESASIVGNEIESSDDMKQYRKNALEYGKSLRGEYRNADTGRTIIINRDSLTEVLHHDGNNVTHIQSIAAIPQMVERGIFITSEPVSADASEKLKNAKEVQYYVCGLNIGGVPYTVKFVVAEYENGERYYDHSLTQIEKGDLLNRAELSSTVADSKSPISGIKDKRLVSILQTNSSKIVDANGEPLVVEHSTWNEDFHTFDISKLGESSGDNGIYGSGFYFGNVGETEMYGDRVIRSYLNVKNPFALPENNMMQFFDYLVDNFDKEGLRDIVVTNSGKSSTMGEVIDAIKEVKANYGRGEYNELIQAMMQYWTPSSAADRVIEQTIFRKVGFAFYRSLTPFIERNIGQIEFSEALRNAGYDGVIYDNHEYVAFYPNQIKLADGSNTTFDSDNDDIRFSVDAELRKRTEKIASEAQKIADKFRLSNEIVVAETQDDYIREIKSEGIPDEDINLDTYAVYMPSGRIVVNAEAVDNMAELSDSIMHEFAHNVTRGGDMLYGLQDTVLEVGEERFEVAGREIFGQTADPLEVADEIIATFVGNAANPTLYDGEDLVSRVFAGYSTEEAIRELLGSLPPDLYNGYADVVEAVMPYVKEVLDAIKTNHDGPRKRTRASEDYRDAQAKTGRVRISVQGYSGSAEAETNRFDNEANAMHATETSVHTKETFGPEGVNEFSIGSAQIASEAESQSGQENALTPQEDKAKDKALKQLDRLNKVINSLRQTVKQAERDNVDLANVVQAALEKEVKDGGINRFLDVPELISLIRSGLDKKSIESTMDRLSERLTDAIIKNREEQLAQLLQVQVQGTNAFGIPIGYAVDDDTRAMVEFFRENLSRDMNKIVEAMASEDDKSLKPYNKSELNVWFTAYKEIEESRYNIKATQKNIDHETERSQSFYRLTKELKAKNAPEGQIKTAQEHRRQALRNKKAQKKAILVAKQTLAQELEGMIFLLGGRLRDGRAIRAGRLSADKVYAKNFLTEAMADVRVNDGTKTFQGTKEELAAKAKFHKDIRVRTAAYRSYAYMIQSVSRNAIGGKGFLWDALMEGKNGWVDCNDKRLAMDNIDNQEILANVQASGLKSVADLQRLFDKQLVDKNGNPYVFRYETDRTGRIDQDIRPTIGWATYIVLCFEQDDMAPTMEKMRITEEQIQQIRDMLPDAAKNFLKWSRKMLEDRRQRIYNPASLERFGTQMANIPNYFPIRRLEKNLHRVEEVEQVASADSDQVTIMANALIKRVRNVVEIDFQQNPLELLKKHLERMNGFAANVPLARNVNILLNSSGFRDQLNEQGDPNTYEYFKAAAKVALSSYKPKPGALDSVMIELQGWLAAGKIAWRFFTALKQLLSLPAFWSYNVSLRYKAIFIRSVLWPAVKNGDEGKLVAIWKWGMDNIPQLKERWSSRYAGNEKLAQVKDTLFAQYIAKHALLRNTVGQIGEWGMIPNAAVDLFACSIGCYAVYKFELEQLQKKGYPKEEADELAKRRASIAFNESQQSSESAFIAPLQRDRTFLAVQVSLFNNSNFGYGRKEKLARKYLWQQTFNKDLREKRLALAKKRYLERFLNEERNRLVENNNKIADVTKRLRPEEIDRMVESKRAEFSKRAEKEANRDAKMAYAKGVEDAVMFKWLLNMAWQMAPTAVAYWLSCAMREGDDEDPQNPLNAETLALMFATATFRNAIGGGVLESALNGYGFTGLVGSEVEKTVDILAQALQPLWLTDEEAESFDPLAVWMAVKQCLVMGTGFDVNVFTNIFTGLVGLFNDRSRTTADVLRILNAPKSMIREIEIVPFEDETLDNYTRRMAMMENVALDRMEELKEKPSSELNATERGELRKMKKWEKNLITIRQAEAAGVPYSREVDGRVVAAELKQLDADYADLLKSLDLTQSGKNRAGKVELTEDERRRKKALRVVTRVKGIRKMEESAAEVINNPGAYRNAYRQIVEEKRTLIEEWNQ